VRTRRNCKCGQCRTCHELARWEHIYREKFADPHYYDPPEPAIGSSLHNPKQHTYSPAFRQGLHLPSE
jgi:hypothetical protein